MSSPDYVLSVHRGYAEADYDVISTNTQELEKHTVANVLASTFRNGVVDRDTVQSADLCPWVAEERYSSGHNS